MRRSIRFLLILSIVLLAAQFQPIESVDAAPCPPEGCAVFLPVVRTGGPMLKIGLVTDTGGVNDGGFNESAWQAVLDAEGSLGVSGAYIESTGESDFSTNIDAFINQGYDLIITVGFSMGDATKAAAQAHPSQKFTIIDVDYDPILPNVVGQAYSVEQPAFVSGYIAAGMTTTGKVATFGGLNIPPVTQFMNGYYQGVQYYNEQNETSVQVLGWDPATSEGEFTYEFVDIPTGKAKAQELLGLGADVIFPVAGQTGLGAAQAVQEQANTWVIGVDYDWKVQYPEYSDVVLTSVMKGTQANIYGIISKVYQGTFTGGTLQGTLANHGASLGTISSAVPQALLDKAKLVKAGIIAGTIVVTP